MLYYLRFSCEDLLIQLDMVASESKYAKLSLLSVMSDLYNVLLELMRFLQQLFEKECRRCFVSFTIGEKIVLTFTEKNISCC